ncbi:MAG: diacylglycerol/lipid kinase family protein [Cellulomonas sp.]
MPPTPPGSTPDTARPDPGPGRASRRVASAAALVLGAASIVLAVVTAWREFPRGLVVAALLALAVAAAWAGIRRRGTGRAVALVAAAGLLVAAVVVLVAGGVILEGAVGVVLLVAAIAAARAALTVHVSFAPAPPPRHPIMVWNPRSGGGKAVTHHLAEEARARGIEPIELTPGVDLVELVRDAVAAGADGLAAAGGDGTQALVATIAAEHDLPFACIPAGTRNHFALDLGVDRDDVVGALDAFVAGGERRIDLAEVNGRVFVNNVSLGLYAEAVQREGYRDAKLRTILATAPDVLGGTNGTEGTNAAPANELHWTDPDGAGFRSAAVILVSNNTYRLGRAIGSGTRPRLDAGRLGIAVLGAQGNGASGPGPDGEPHAARMRQWSAAEFEVGSAAPVPAGVDGEALLLEPPLRFTSRPAVLRVRIAPQHPGASPSAALPETVGRTIELLARMALHGDDPRSSR